MTPLELKALESAVHQLRISALIHRAQGDVTVADINEEAAEQLRIIVRKHESEVAA